MPVENEFNYVLHDADGGLRGRLDHVPGVRRFDMRQGYLDEDTRLRAFHDLDTGEVSYVFSFKRKVGGESIEVEKDIPAEDFRKLYGECATKLRKTRYAFVEGGVHWDVDFLRTKSGRTYFVKAEAEVPADVKEAPEPCASIAPCVIAVPGKARGFSSRRLADDFYAKRVLETLLRRHAKSAERRSGRGMAMAA